MTSENEGFGPDGSGAKLAEALSGVDPFLTATPEDVADDLQRAFARARVPGAQRGSLAEAVTLYPGLAAETAMNMVRPVLEAKDRRIAQLEKTAPVAGALARVEERARIVKWLQDMAVRSADADTDMSLSAIYLSIAWHVETRSYLAGPAYQRNTQASPGTENTEEK